MVYEYSDRFLIDGIDETQIEDIEAKKYDFVLNRLNIDDSYYLEKLTKALVYMELAKRQLESEGMKAKYDIYKAEYEHFLSLAKTGGEVCNIKLQRG